MNATETLINKGINLQPKPEDPANFLSGSVPGLGMSYDRKKQLLIIDQNLNTQKRLAANMLKRYQAGDSEREDDPYGRNNFGVYDGRNVSSGVYDKRVINQQHNGMPVSKSMQLKSLTPAHDSGREKVGLRPSTPKNDFEFFKLKNGSWPGKMDIISNKMRY